MDDKEDEKIMQIITKVMKLLGCQFQEEIWYDEEGIKGTTIILPNKQKILVYEWGKEIDLNELLDKLRESNLKTFK